MSNKRTFFRKLFTFFIINSLILSGIFFIAASKYINSANMDLFTRELNAKAMVVMPFITSYLRKSDYAGLRAETEFFSGQFGSRITVVKPDGEVVADSEYSYSTMSNHANREEIRSVLDGAASWQSVRYSSTLQENMLYMAMPLDSDGNIIGVLRLSMPVKDIDMFTSATLKNIAAAFFIVIAFSFFAAYLISRKMTAGIAAMREAVNNVSKGNFNAKVDFSGSDEIGELAASFNRMSEEIDLLFNEVNEGREMLDKILASVSNGIVLIDKEGKTLLINGMLKNFYPDAAVGRFFWEYIRGSEIGKSIEKAQTGKEAFVSGDICREDKIFAYTVSKVKKEERFVISLEDVTGVRRLENFKKDFITSASHELKTPVTSIAGFAETLDASNLNAENKKYIEIIKKQAQRLSNLISDLLSLSALENQREPDKKKFNLTSLVENISEFYRKKVSGKNISVICEIDKPLNDIYADEFNMEQLIVNLMDNAVKYTEAGTVKIKVENADKFVAITVSDTGIGIAKEHIPRIFERFYVADKSRSRKSGGTGLGLSIVKHIVQIHNGTVEVESSEGAGSRFTVSFPAVQLYKM